MPTESQNKPKKNTQANASLILGAASLSSALFDFARGDYSFLGFLGAAAALLAFVAGVRGLRAARQLEEQGRKLAIAGIATGGLGLLLFINTFNVANERFTEELLTQLTPQPSQTFQGDGFTLTYPGGWEAIDIDTLAGLDSCQPPFECLFSIGHPSHEGTHINLIRLAVEEGLTIEEIDQALWTQLEADIPDVILESRDIIEVGGQPAIRRVFSIPSSEEYSVMSQILQVYILNELTVYAFTGINPSADALNQHRETIEGVIMSMQFSP